MDEFFLHEGVTVYNPYKCIWESGKIVGKFYDFTDPTETTYIYSVQVGNGETIQDIYEDALLKINIWKQCVCGSESTNQPGHSYWCDKV